MRTLAVAVSLPAAAQQRYEEQTNRPADRGADPSLNRPAERPATRDEVRQDAKSAGLPAQFDAVLHFDETRGLQPLERAARFETGEAPETYPVGI